MSVRLNLPEMNGNAKHVAMVSSVFPPETVVAGRMAAEVAARLVQLGHKVSVISPYPSRLGTLPKGACKNGRTLKVEDKDGFALYRVASTTAPESKLWPRMRESWSFGRCAARILESQIDRPDVVYEMAWPMLAQAWVSQCSARLGVPRVTHIQDIYPESALRRIPACFIAGVGPPLKWLDRINARRAVKVIVVSENMRRTYEATRGILPQKLEIVETWQDEEPFLRLPDRNEAALHYKTSATAFTFMYLGNIGAVAGVEHLIRSFAAAKLEGAQLLIAGEGSQKEACIRLATDMKAPIYFISDPDVKKVPLLQSLGDICLLPVKRGAAFFSIPSKLSAYMLSAKPVLASVDSDSDSAKLISKAKCGWIIEPEDVEAMAAKMRELRTIETGRLAAIGHSGRAYALERLTKGRCAGKLVRIIVEAAQARG